MKNVYIRYPENITKYLWYYSLLHTIHFMNIVFIFTNHKWSKNATKCGRLTEQHLQCWYIFAPRQITNKMLVFISKHMKKNIHVYTGCSKKKVTILNGYNFFNIHGRWMKQTLAESWDFKILLHLFIYFSYILLLAKIELY